MMAKIRRTGLLYSIRIASNRAHIERAKGALGQVFLVKLFRQRGQFLLRRKIDHPFNIDFRCCNSAYINSDRKFIKLSTSGVGISEVVFNLP